MCYALNKSVSRLFQTVVLAAVALLSSPALAGLVPYAVAPYGSSYTAHAINHAVAAPVAAAPLAAAHAFAAPLAAAPAIAAPLAAAPYIASPYLASPYALPAHAAYVVRR